MRDSASPVQVPTTRDFAATTFVVEDGRTLLLWHLKTRAWLPPGGHVEPNELPDDAAVREVHEETGLTVELLGETRRWGTVGVLRRPFCVLLERIAPGHEHVDLIYYARVTGGILRLDPREASAHRWCTSEDLGGADIAEDIRILGREALAAVTAGPQPGSG